MNMSTDSASYFQNLWIRLCLFVNRWERINHYWWNMNYCNDLSVRVPPLEDRCNPSTQLAAVASPRQVAEASGIPQGSVARTATVAYSTNFPTRYRFSLGRCPLSASVPAYKHKLYIYDLRIHNTIVFLLKQISFPMKRSLWLCEIADEQI